MASGKSLPLPRRGYVLVDPPDRVTLGPGTSRHTTKLFVCHFPRHDLRQGIPKDRKSQQQHCVTRKVPSRWRDRQNYSIAPLFRITAPKYLHPLWRSARCVWGDNDSNHEVCTKQYLLCCVVVHHGNDPQRLDKPGGRVGRSFTDNVS